MASTIDTVSFRSLKGIRSDGTKGDVLKIMKNGEPTHSVFRMEVDGAGNTVPVMVYNVIDAMIIAYPELTAYILEHPELAYMIAKNPELAELSGNELVGMLG